MSTSEDVSNLFRKFGGQPEEYQELSRDFQAEESKARWPLLSSVRLAREAIAPSVSDGEMPVATAPVPNLPASASVAAAGSVAPFAPPPADVPVVTERVVATPSEEVVAPRAGTLTRSLFKKSAPAPASAAAPASVARATTPVAAPHPTPAPAQPPVGQPAGRLAGQPVPAASVASKGPAEPSFKSGQGLASLAKPARAYPSAAASVSAAYSQQGPLARLRASADTGAAAASSGTLAGSLAGVFGEAPGSAPSAPQETVPDAAATVGSRQLTDILSRIAGSPTPAAEPKKTSLFARLSRL